MIEVLIKTKTSKINDKFNPKTLKAGIAYNENGKAMDKILFYELDGFAKEVWNDIYYPKEIDGAFCCYVDDVIDVSGLFIDTFGEGPLTLSQLYIGYKMFLNDTHYLSRHLSDFGMFEREVGYKSKTEFARDPKMFNYEKQELFEGLMKIINYKDLNKKEYEISGVTKRK